MEVVEKMPGSPVVAVYLHGTGDRQDNGDTQESWYRVEFPMMTKEPYNDKLFGERKQISPVATLSQDSYGSEGSWDVIGDNIYWAGGVKWGKRGTRTLCEYLFKHNINHVDPTSWQIESSSMKIPRKSPFVAAIGSKKLYFVGGNTYRTYKEYYSDDEDDDDDDDDGRWNKCGEIYDLDSKTWKYLDVDYNILEGYDTSNQIALVENDSEEPTQIVLYSLYVGSTMLLDVTNGTLDGPVAHMDFASWHYSMMEGQNREDVVGMPGVAHHVKAVFTNDTFYWFDSDMCLYGYDINDQRWLRSTSLEEQLPSMVVNDYNDFALPRYPILVRLQDGRLLVILSRDSGELTIAPLTVVKEQNSLIVLVESVQHFSIDDHSFIPSDGKAV